MAQDLNSQLQRVRAKASVLMEKYAVLKEAFDSQREEIEQLKAELIVKTRQIENLSMKVEHLSIASSVKLSGDDLQATRNMIADLVREVDRCIADLSD